MPESTARRPVLLLVDDTPTNIQVLVGLLKSDYDLKVAPGGAQALRIAAAAERIDLVLLDVMMPEMDGFEVCQRLRAEAKTRDLPIIFLTAKTEVDDVVRGFEVGGNDYVAKPFRPPELLARVRTQLLIRAQQREIAEKNTELREMLQIMCHDIANHFGVINMSLELMALNGLGNKYTPVMSAAVRNGAGLTQVVRDLRRSEEKAVLMESVSLVAALDEVLLLAEGRLQEKQLAVTKDVPAVQVAAEACALTNSVFGNVISNAIKFSRPGGRIEIAANVEGDQVCIRLRDHGVGMPADVLETLFDVSKSHSRTGTAGERGTGFGMPLMKKFVTLFGGTVEVTSREAAATPDDHGTEFKIRLKLAK